MRLIRRMLRDIDVYERNRERIADIRIAVHILQGHVVRAAFANADR